MPSDYFPPGAVVPGYRVPDLTDPPDVPGDLRSFADRLHSQGDRLKWGWLRNGTAQYNKEFTLNPNTTGTFLNVDVNLPYAGTYMVFFSGHITLGNVGPAQWRLYLHSGSGSELAEHVGNTRTGIAGVIPVGVQGWGKYTTGITDTIMLRCHNYAFGTALAVRFADLNWAIWQVGG